MYAVHLVIDCCDWTPLSSSAATEAPAGAAQEGVAVVGAGQGGAGVTAGLALGGTAATLLVAALALALLYRRRASNKLLTVKATVNCIASQIQQSSSTVLSYTFQTR